MTKNLNWILVYFCSSRVHINKKKKNLKNTANCIGIRNETGNKFKKSNKIYFMWTKSSLLSFFEIKCSKIFSPKLEILTNTIAKASSRSSCIIFLKTRVLAEWLAGSGLVGEVVGSNLALVNSVFPGAVMGWSNLGLIRRESLALRGQKQAKTIA